MGILNLFYNYYNFFKGGKYLKKFKMKTIFIIKYSDKLNILRGQTI